MKHGFEQEETEGTEQQKIKSLRCLCCLLFNGFNPKVMGNRWTQAGGVTNNEFRN